MAPFKGLKDENRHLKKIHAEERLKSICSGQIISSTILGGLQFITSLFLAEIKKWLVKVYAQRNQSIDVFELT